MAKNPSISNQAAIDACDAITAALDAAGQPFVAIYAGTPPARPDVPVTGQPLLALLEMAFPSFAGATDATPGATAVANTITDDSFANKSGTATFFRARRFDGATVIQGTVGESDADMIVDNVVIEAGQTVQVLSFKYTYAETD